MTQISIRQSGDANILSIPKATLSLLDLHVGSCLDLRVEDNCIVLTPPSHEPTLEALLAGSPKKNLGLTDDDKEWLQDAPIKNEI